MLNVPSEMQAVIKNDATLKNFRVHFPNGERADITNDNIVFESVSFTESVCSNDIFKFGLAEASVIEFVTIGIENIVGMTIQCSMEFKVPASLQATYGQWYSVPYGTFVIDKCPRDHNNMARRKVIGYSLLKNIAEKQNFLQNMVLPVPSVHVTAEALCAYATGDVSFFEENTSRTPYIGSSYLPFYLYDSDGKPYDVQVLKSGNPSTGGLARYNIRSVAIQSQSPLPDKTIFYDGYKLNFEETGSITNEEVGDSISDYITDTLGLSLLYDANGKKVFNSNKDALKRLVGFIFSPIVCQTTVSGEYGIYYYGNETPINCFCPIFRDDKIDENQKEFYIYCLSEFDTVRVRKCSTANIYGSGATWTTVGETTIQGFSSQYSFIAYERKNFVSRPLIIDSTLATNSSLMYRRRVSNKEKDFYGNMFAYSNAYSNREILSGFAELSCSFIHSERDGSISVETLDNSSPYSLLQSDVEDSAWWDEYDVNPIGVVKYTFYNPYTGYIANGSYEYNSENKSIYDLSGNEVFEKMDFSVFKATTAAKMSNKNVIYKYTGSESGYVTDDFYYFDGESQEWVSGGHYENVTSVVNFVLENIFMLDVNSVNFTPVEMDIRGLPFLEAGDAFTLTLSDGTVLNSYILNHRISGIQHLTDSIDSVSGEVIE